MRERFWEHYALAEMSPAEWEALCDGCGRCCLQKFIKDNSEEVLYTNVACRKLDSKSCRCRCYATRKAQVPDCIDISNDIQQWNWLPATCAYRRLAEGKRLPEWHPLLSGSRASVHAAGISVRGKVLSEDNVHPQELEQHIVRWVT